MLKMLYGDRRSHNNSMFHSGQADLNNGSKPGNSLIEYHDGEMKTSKSSTNTAFHPSMNMTRRGSTGDIKNGGSGKGKNVDVNNNTDKMESMKRKFSCPEIEAIIGQYVNPNDIKSSHVSLHTGTMRRCRSLNELPGSIRVPIIRRGETDRMKARLEASRAGTEELKILRENQEKRMQETINCVNVKKMAVQNNKFNQTRRMSGPVLSPGSGLSKITEDVEQTFPNDVFLDKNLRDRTNLDASTHCDTQSYTDITEFHGRRSFSLRKTDTAHDSSTNVDKSWIMLTKRAENLPYTRSSRSHSFSLGSNTVDGLLHSPSYSAVNSENIEPMLRRASLQGHAAITGINFEKRGSSVFENMDISSTSPNPLHAVLMQYSLSGSTPKTRTIGDVADTKCTNDNSVSNTNTVSHSVINQTDSAIKDRKNVGAISKFDKSPQEYEGRLSYSKSKSYSKSYICQNETTKTSMENDPHSPKTLEPKAKHVDDKQQSATIHVPAEDTSFRVDNVFKSCNQQIPKQFTTTNKPTTRFVNERSVITCSNEHLERKREARNSHSGHLSECSYKAHQSIQSTSDHTALKSTIIFNEDHPKKSATCDRSKEQHNFNTDSKNLFCHTDVRHSAICKGKDDSKPPVDDTQSEINALSLSDDVNTYHGHEKLSPINSPDTSDIEMVSDVFSFSSVDLMNYSSQSPQHQKLTSIASDEGFVTSTPSLECTSSNQTSCIGNDSYGFHSRSLSVASDEGYSASPPLSPKQKLTSHQRYSIASGKKTARVERRKSGSKIVTKDKPTRSFKQTAV